MARIKLYESQARAPGARGAVTTGVRFSAADFSSQALSANIKQVAAVAEAYQKKAKQDERNATEKFLAETRMNWTQKMASDMEEATLRGDGAAGFTENLMSSFDDYVKQNSNSGSDEDNIYRKTQLNKIQAGLLGPSARFQAKEAGIFRTQTMTTAQNSHMSNVYTNPDSLNNAIQEIRTTAERLGLTGQALKDQVKSSSNELGKMTLTGIIDRMTPQEAEKLHKELTNGTSDWVTKIEGEDVDNMARYAKKRAAAGAKAITQNKTMFNAEIAASNKRVNNGFLMDDQTVNRLTELLDKMPNEQTKRIAIQKFNNLVAKNATVQSIQKLSVPLAVDQANLLVAEAAKAGASELDIEIALVAQKTVKRMQTEAQDPVQMGMKRGEINPVDVNSPESLLERQEQAAAFANKNNVKFEMFSKQEINSITNQFDGATPIERSQIAANIVTAAGDRAITVMDSFKKINKNLAVMGALKAQNDHVHDETIQMIAKGTDLSKNIMERGEYQDLKVEIESMLRSVLFETGADNLEAHTNAAIAFYLGKGGTARAAKALGRPVIYEKKLAEEAVQSVLGHPRIDEDNLGEGLHEVNGGARIILPFDVRGDEFDNALEIMNDSELQFYSATGGAPIYRGKIVQARDLLDNAIPVVDRPLSQLNQGEIAYSFRDKYGDFVQDSETGARFQIVLSAEKIDELLANRLQK
tara:strand:- start:4665 stop:6755 length:2091 start_codon:yes stop_codon:yes gene_type:complete